MIRSQRGVTLVEMLVLMAAPAATLGGNDARPTAPAPASIFQLGPTDAIARLTGAGTGLNGCQVKLEEAAKQPMVVIASSAKFGFEVDCKEADSRDRLASYIPRANFGGDSLAAAPDTAVFFFQSDPSTARTDDFVMLRQVSGERPVAILRNVLPYPGRPFFQYYYRKPADNAKPSTHLPVPANWLPLRHGPVKHGAVADTGLAARIDTLRAVEISYTISNGKVGPGERLQRYSNIVPLVDLSRKKSKICEREPFVSNASYMPIYGAQSLLAARHACAPMT